MQKIQKGIKKEIRMIHIPTVFCIPSTFGKHTLNKSSMLIIKNSNEAKSYKDEN